MIFLKIPNRIYLFIIALAMLITGYGFENERQERIDWTMLGPNILIVAGIFFLLKNGTFFQSRYFRLVFSGFAIILSGALLKIMHWPFAGYLLIIGMLLIAAIYLIHFLQKTEKQIVDYLKLIWMISFYILRLSFPLHWFKDDYNFGLINEILFFVILVIVFYEKKKDPEWINE